jgi:hypothetical protein
MGSLHQFVRGQRDGDVAPEGSGPVEKMPHHIGTEERMIAGGQQHGLVLGQRGQSSGGAGRGRGLRRHPADAAIRHHPAQFLRSMQRFVGRTAQ